jgi:hypothetical protein
MPTCAPESTNESRSVTWSARGGGPITLGRGAPETPAVGGHVAEFLGHEIAGDGGDQQDQRQPDEDHHGRAEDGEQR